LPALSCAVTTGWVVKALPPVAPAGGVEKASLDAAPEASVTLAAALVAVHVRHTTVTVYWCAPAETPVSVQLVALVGDAEPGQAALAAPPSRET
jgi:hypothetical protein